MNRDPTPAQEVGRGYAHVALGCTFAGGVVMFMGGGWLLDRWVGTTPLFTVAGALVGAVLGFLGVYWRLQAEAAAERRRRGETREP